VVWTQVVTKKEEMNKKKTGKGTKKGGWWGSESGKVTET
jgi:hypothetical protein